MLVPTPPPVASIERISPTVYEAARRCVARASWAATGSRARVPLPPRGLLGSSAHAIFERIRRAGLPGGTQEEWKRAADAAFDEKVGALFAEGCGSSSSTDFSPVHRLFCSRTVPSVRFARGQAPTGLFSGSQPGLINGAWALRSVPPGPPPGHSRSVLVACRGKGDSSEMAVVTTTRLSGRAFWVALGATSGRGRLDRRRHRAGETLKTVGVCPLVGNAQRRWRES